MEPREKGWSGVKQKVEESSAKFHEKPSKEIESVIQLGYELMTYLTKKSKAEFAEYRPGQYRVLVEIASRMISGQRNIDVVMPTGAGKTWIMKEILQAQKSRPMLTLTYSNIIVDQIASEFKNSSTKNVIKNEVAYTPSPGEVNICVQPYQKIQKFTNNGGEGKPQENATKLESVSLTLNPGTVLIVDEAHRKLGENDSKHVTKLMNEALATITFTATPDYKKKGKFGEDAKWSVQSKLSGVDFPIEITFLEALEMGIISNFEEYQALWDCPQELNDNLNKNQKENRKNALVELEKEATLSTIRYLLETGTRKIIVSCEKVKLAREINNLLNSEGNTQISRFLDAKDRRTSIREEIRSGFLDPESTLSVVTGSDIIGTGLDFPNAEAVVIVGKKGSEVDVRQISGRALRLYPGKVTSKIYHVVPNDPELSASFGLNLYSTVGLEEPVKKNGNGLGQKLDIPINQEIIESLHLRQPKVSIHQLFDSRQAIADKSRQSLDKPTNSTEINIEEYTEVSQFEKTRAAYWFSVTEAIKSLKPEKLFGAIVVQGEHQDAKVLLRNDLVPIMVHIRQEWNRMRDDPSLTTLVNFCKSMNISPSVYTRRIEMGIKPPNVYLAFSLHRDLIVKKYKTDDLIVYMGIETPAEPKHFKFDQHGKQIWFTSNDIDHFGVEIDGKAHRFNAKTLAKWARSTGHINEDGTLPLPSQIVDRKLTDKSRRSRYYHINLITAFLKEIPNTYDKQQYVPKGALVKASGYQLELHTPAGKRTVVFRIPWQQFDAIINMHEKFLNKEMPGYVSRDFKTVVNSENSAVYSIEFVRWVWNLTLAKESHITVSEYKGAILKWIRKYHPNYSREDVSYKFFLALGQRNPSLKTQHLHDNDGNWGDYVDFNPENMKFCEEQVKIYKPQRAKSTDLNYTPTTGSNTI